MRSHHIAARTIDKNSELRVGRASSITWRILLIGLTTSRRQSTFEIVRCTAHKVVLNKTFLHISRTKIQKAMSKTEGCISHVRKLAATGRRNWDPSCRSGRESGLIARSIVVRCPRRTPHTTNRVGSNDLRLVSGQGRKAVDYRARNNVRVGSFFQRL